MQNKIKIIVADDNPHIRQTLKDILSEKDYLTETVKDGYELLVNLKEKEADIIILDIIMPKKDGLEIISAIKSISPNAKIIIYTGFKKYENSTYVHSVDKFLLKGDSPEELLKTIEELTKSHKIPASPKNP